MDQHARQIVHGNSLRLDIARRPRPQAVAHLRGGFFGAGGSSTCPGKEPALASATLQSASLANLRT